MKAYKHYLALFLLFCGILPAGGCAAKAADDDVKLYSLNIGKADCLILCCADQYFLIDTGYAHTYAALETALASLNIHHLNGVFLTHCHEDHHGGLMQLAKSGISIDHFYAASIYYDVKEKKHPMILAANERNMVVEWLSSGDVIPIADGYSFRVLGPMKMNEENENNNSLVMYFSSPHGSILFAGDMKDDEENELMYHHLIQPCDVLKVGHHGDNGATSKAFLNTVMPRCAIISTHTEQEPDSASPEVLFRLNRINCDTYTTQGNHDAICVALNNGEIAVQEIIWHSIPQWINRLDFNFDADKNTLELYNAADETIRLSGCTLYLAKKDEVILLDDISLAPGTAFIIGGKKAAREADLKLDVKKVLDEKKLDAAIIYDAHGRIIAICNNGKEE